MGKVRDTPWKKRDIRVYRAAYRFGVKKPRTSAPKRDPDVRYSNDGFWTTQHPSAKPFSFEWFNVHISMFPYFWEMFKMAISVSKAGVVTIIFGTIARAFVDAAQLYAYTRFVNEVRLSTSQID
jgi:hypothetical protein